MTYYIWLGRTIPKDRLYKHKTDMEFEPYFFSFAFNN